MIHGSARASYAFASRQRGAVFFVALMLLIVLTLLGLSAAQVTALQERMAAVYRSDRMAFENAEGLLAQQERMTSGLGAGLNVICENFYKGAGNTETIEDGSDFAIENLGKGASFLPTIGTLEAGIASEIGDQRCLFLQITTYAYDDPDAQTARALVQSIYVP